MILKPNYKTSKDYGKLYDIAQKERIVCFIYKDNEIPDIAITQPKIREDKELAIFSRGIIYVDGISFKNKIPKEDFIESCKKMKVEYIIPNGENK